MSAASEAAACASCAFESASCELRVCCRPMMPAAMGEEKRDP